MTTLQAVFKTFVPQAIDSGNTCYQEHLRGTSKEDLYVPIAARVGSLVPQALAPYLSNQTGCPQTIVSVAMNLLIMPKILNSYGASRGYNLDFGRELMVLNLVPEVSNFIYWETTPKSRAKSTNQKRVAFLLHTLVVVGAACIMVKFQSERNSVPLKPYLYFAAGTTLVSQLKNYHFDSDINTVLGEIVPYPYQVNAVVSKILIGFCMAKGVGFATGQQIQMAWRWEILSSVASSASAVFLA